MTITEMLSQSGVLTLLGMGVVFGFLVILIICISLSSKVIRALKLDKDEEQSTVGTQSASGTQNNAVIAAIAAAVRQKQG